MDENTAKTILELLETTNKSLNELTTISTQFIDHDEQVAFRRLLAKAMIAINSELWGFVLKQYPMLDPDKDN